eukprot:CAMPEP_0197318576 /NCGR_PEP_ID=MMETSP0891-20130614/51652_1 /TAXON_ID=44058 ORGANISM="Aureoumbra lagunensis, Strain CCMP1510" /NCGR_SAMPLE_ID=MMETSP0891 /ASSEMBLY_ACC=CAM_ASM_000534 /LENGTH=226 /DNA_ID=CAMNT_0042809117 /DNA_START=877 /DNA_END=1557 /DNA_ORIENTATION=+
MNKIMLIILLYFVKAIKNELSHTGQVVCGMVFCDGVVIGADENAGGFWREEIFRELCPNIWGCGVGLQAEADEISRRTQMELKSRYLSIERVTPRQDKWTVYAVARLLRSLFHQESVEFLVLGFDENIPRLIRIGKSKAISAKPWAIVGPGANAALSQLVQAATFPPDQLTKEKALQAVQNALLAAIDSDDFAAAARLHILILEKNKKPQISALSSHQLRQNNKVY